MKKRGWFVAGFCLALVLLGQPLRTWGEGQKIAAGASHTLLIKPDGSLWGLGNTAGGQLEGVSDDQDRRFKPFRIGSDTNWLSVTAGENSSYGIRKDGTLWAWGKGTEDGGPVLGDGTGADRTSPVRIGGETNWVEVRSMGSSVFGRKSDGSLWAWGRNSGGSLGIGRGRDALQYRPTAVAAEISWKRVVAFRRLVVSPSGFVYGGAGLDEDGKLYVWGSASVFTSTLNYRPVLVEPSSTNRWNSLAVSSPSGISSDFGSLTAVAVRLDGTLWKWEAGVRSQVGSDADWLLVSARGQHVLAIKTDGTLWSWGQNVSGQLGLGDEENREEPEEVIFLGEGQSWAEVAAGDVHSVGLDSEGNFYAWGRNTSGQCGGEDPYQKTRPHQVDPDEDLDWLDQVVAGEDFTLAARADGEIWAWGGGLKSLPETAGDENNLGWAYGLASTDERVMALDDQGRLSIWGNAADEWPGLTEPWWDTVRNEPGPVGTNTFKELSANGHVPNLISQSKEKFSVGVTQNGSIYSWGSNSYGQLGDGSVVEKDFGSPAQVLPAGKWRTASVGGGHVLAIRTDGTLWSWGNNKATDHSNGVTIASGQLGIATITKPATGPPTSGPVAQSKKDILPIDGTPVPRQVGTNADWAMVSAGRAHSLALKTDGTLWAWGYHKQGQVGVGYAGSTNPAEKVLTNQFLPVSVGNPFWRWSWISAGDSHSAAIRRDGTLWLWGANTYGQLGDGSREIRVKPGQTGGANDWVRVWCGGEHTLGLKKDGSLWSWGQNEKGQLGLGLSTGFSSPEPVEATDVGGLSTLLVYSNQAQVGAGVISFSFRPDQSKATISLHLDTGPATRQQIQGTVSFEASPGSLRLDSFKIDELSWPGRTSTDGFFFRPGDLVRSVGRPQEYAGPVRLVQTTNITVLATNGTNVSTNQVRKTLFSLNLRLVAVLGGDEDGDGVPDSADVLPYGPKPKILGIAAGARLRAVVGQPFLYGWRSLPGADAYFIESQIPAGLADTGGVLEGTPTRDGIGNHVLILAASNRAGSSYQAIGLHIVPAAPDITSATNATWTLGTPPFRYQITATEDDHANFPLSFRARDLPPHTRLNNRTGLLSAVASGSDAPPQGIYRILLQVHHKEGKDRKILTLRVNPTDGIHGRVGEPMRFAMSLAAGKRGRFSSSDLPPGLQMDSSTGWISGVPTAAGDFAVQAVFNGRRSEFRQEAVLRIAPEAMAPARAAHLPASLAGTRPLLFSSGLRMSKILAAGNQSTLPTELDLARYRWAWEDVELWQWNRTNVGLAASVTPREQSEQAARRERLRWKNPSAQRLARVSYESAVTGSWLPEEDSGWLRDSQGRVLSPAGGGVLGLIDFSRPEVVRKIAARVRHLMQSGLIDGVYLSGWDEASVWPTGSFPAKGTAGGPQLSARIELLQSLREAVGPQGLIFAEAAGSSWWSTGPLLDGVHLAVPTDSPPSWPPPEGWCPDPYRLSDPQGHIGWDKIRESLAWFGQPGLLRTPGNVALELWSRYDLQDPRTRDPRLTGLAMSLCFSDGAYLYARPDWWQQAGQPAVPGQHLWYPEWSLSLGTPWDPMQNQPDSQGVFRRRFEKGWAVYAPASIGSSPLGIGFDEEVESVATGKSGRIHGLLPGRGDLFLKKN